MIYLTNIFINCMAPNISICSGAFGLPLIKTHTKSFSFFLFVTLFRFSSSHGVHRRKFVHICWFHFFYKFIWIYLGHIFFKPRHFFFTREIPWCKILDSWINFLIQFSSLVIFFQLIYEFYKFLRKHRHTGILVFFFLTVFPIENFHKVKVKPKRKKKQNIK